MTPQQPGTPPHERVVSYGASGSDNEGRPRLQPSGWRCSCGYQWWPCFWAAKEEEARRDLKFPPGPRRCLGQSGGPHEYEHCQGDRCSYLGHTSEHPGLGCHHATGAVNIAGVRERCECEPVPWSTPPPEPGRADRFGRKVAKGKAFIKPCAGHDEPDDVCEVCAVVWPPASEEERLAREIVAKSRVMPLDVDMLLPLLRSCASARVKQELEGLRNRTVLLSHSVLLLEGPPPLRQVPATMIETAPLLKFIEAAIEKEQGMSGILPIPVTCTYSYKVHKEVDGVTYHKCAPEDPFLTRCFGDQELTHNYDLPDHHPDNNPEDLLCGCGGRTFKISFGDYNVAGECAQCGARGTIYSG